MVRGHVRGSTSHSYAERQSRGCFNFLLLAAGLFLELGSKLIAINYLANIMSFILFILKWGSNPIISKSQQNLDFETGKMGLDPHSPTMYELDSVFWFYFIVILAYVMSRLTDNIDLFPIGNNITQNQVDMVAKTLVCVN